MKALDNACYGSWMPLTNLTQTFERVICALLMWPPFFFGAIPTYGVLPYAMIYVYVADDWLIQVCGDILYFKSLDDSVISIIIHD